MKDKRLDEIELVRKNFTRPMPNNGVEMASRLAADLVEGSLRGYWTSILEIDNHDSNKTVIRISNSSYLEAYINTIWLNEGYVGRPNNEATDSLSYRDFEPLLILLIGMGYLTQIEGEGYICSEKAYALLGKTEIKLFISYSVNQSSALAMLIWSELKREGYSPFLDIRNISAGDQWHKVLKEKVESSDFFIVILAPETLKSDFVRKELEWANGAKNTKIIPIILPGFDEQNLNDGLEVVKNSNFIKLRAATSVEFTSMLNQLLASINLVK